VRVLPIRNPTLGGSWFSAILLTSGKRYHTGKEGDVAMMIKLVEKERYSIMPPASRHQHDCRILETKDNRIRIKLDRTIDTRPPFFTAYDLSIRRPHPPSINVAGKENWGFGLTWKKAITVLTNQVSENADVRDQLHRQP
jgi:hypothetical protein